MKDSEHKDISDPTYSAADFWLQLTGGRLRWFASVLATASVGVFIYMLTDGWQAELFPFHIYGLPAYLIVGISFVVWTSVAVLNWKRWRNRKNDAA